MASQKGGVFCFAIRRLPCLARRSLGIGIAWANGRLRLADAHAGARSAHSAVWSDKSDRSDRSDNGVGFLSATGIGTAGRWPVARQLPRQSDHHPVSPYPDWHYALTRVILCRLLDRGAFAEREYILRPLNLTRIMPPQGVRPVFPGFPVHDGMISIKRRYGREKWKNDAA